jgi:hypothetical protein
LRRRSAISRSLRAAVFCASCVSMVVCVDEVNCDRDD